MWMLDVFCCALGCVTLLWLLKTREASDIADEASQASSLLVETRGKLDESNSIRFAPRERRETLGRFGLPQQAARPHRQERDDNAKHLALAEEELDKTKHDLVAARTRVDDLEKMTAGLNSKLTASDAELVKKRGELELLNKRARAGEKGGQQAGRPRPDQGARPATDFESKLKESEKKLDDVTRSVGDQAKLQAKIDKLEKDLKAERTRLDEANVTIVDLQGTKAKLADKLNKIQIESDNKFAGIAMTGKNVVFLVDMSGSMDRTEENVMAPDKWPGVRDTVCKVMRSIPDLEKFQVILFSGHVRYLLEAGDWMPYEKEKSIDRVHKAMTVVKPAEDTNLYAGLEEAFKYRSKGLDTVYFFSDGLPTSGPGLTAAQERSLTSETERSAILSRHIRRTLATTWNRPEPGKTKVRINSIGFFYESPDVGAFLWALSRENDGSFVGMSRP